jgi:hypothetical protein
MAGIWDEFGGEKRAKPLVWWLGKSLHRCSESVKRTFPERTSI